MGILVANTCNYFLLIFSVKYMEQYPATSKHLYGEKNLLIQSCLGV
jgi:hypothetical protein